EWDDSIAEAETGLTLAEEVQSHFGEVAVHCVLGMIALHRNEIRRAQKALAHAQVDLASSGPQHHSDWVLWVKGLIAERAGDDVEALEVLREGPRPLERALTAEELGHALVRADRTDEALGYLDEAFNGFEKLGAALGMVRVNAALRRLGVPRGQRGTRPGRPV